MGNEEKTWIELFEGLVKSEIQLGGGGYIFNAHLHGKHNYAIFEIIGFENVKQIISGENSVTFQSDGYKIFIVFESRNFPTKYVEPYLRQEGEKVPLRWNETEILELPNRDRIFISKAPYISYGTFTVEAPETGSFVYYFYNNSAADKNILSFIKDVLREDFKVPKKNAEVALIQILKNLEVFHKDTAA